MTNKITKQMLKDLREVLDYVNENEAEDFEHYIADGNDPETHVYSNIERLYTWLGEK